MGFCLVYVINISILVDNLLFLLNEFLFTYSGTKVPQIVEKSGIGFCDAL